MLSYQLSKTVGDALDDKTDDKTNNKADNKADDKPNNKADNKPDDKPDNKPNNKADNKPDNKPDDKTADFFALQEIKQRLDKTKSLLDDEYKKNNFETYWREFDPFRDERAIIAKIGNTYNVSNAWLKCYELLTHFDLIPETTNGEFMHFDNAAFPGSFIVCTHHFVKTQRDWHAAYKWRGSSLLADTALQDKYKLFENYPEQWLMSQNNDGDVLKKENQLNFYEQLGEKVDLYTSDLGFDVSSDFNNQELLQSKANVGQVLTGLLTLKLGGNFITKQYTTFEPITLGLMQFTSECFDEFYLCKPATSRMANSETYLVGKGFKLANSLDNPGIIAVLDWLGQADEKHPFGDINNSFVELVAAASADMADAQINKINEDIKRVSDCLDYKGRPGTHPIVLKFKEQNEEYLNDWYVKTNIRPITNQKKLRMYDLYKQYYSNKY